LSAEDDTKLVFGTVYSLRNMVRKLGGDDDKYAYLLAFGPWSAWGNYSAHAMD
jgi:hypothetical protein